MIALYATASGNHIIGYLYQTAREIITHSLSDIQEEKLIRQTDRRRKPDRLVRQVNQKGSAHTL